MLTTREKTAVTPSSITRDPLGRLRRMAQELDRLFAEPVWLPFRAPMLRGLGGEETTWAPRIEVFEKENRLVTRIELPGMKKEEVKVEVTDGNLVISGERKRESEEKEKHFYRSEREYGAFYRAVPLPEGVSLEHIKATFAEGVLEVTVPLPAAPEEEKPHRIAITEPETAAKPAA